MRTVSKQMPTIFLRSRGLETWILRHQAKLSSISALADEALASGLGIERRWCSWCASLPWWCADGLFARQDFDDDHRCATVRANEGRLDRFV